MFHFSKAAIAAAIARGNSGVTEQMHYVANARAYEYEVQQEMNARRPQFALNAARTPADVWRDFDASARTIMTGDDGMGLLLDLEALARNVDVGKTISEYRQIGEAELEVRISMDGNHQKPVNKGSTSYDGTPIPVYSTQIGCHWREYRTMLSEGYDELADLRDDGIRTVRRELAYAFVNGVSLTHKGYTAYGIKNNPNTLALNLGAGGLAIDLTSPSTTYEQMRTVFVAVLKTVQGSGNNAVGAMTHYLSDAIWFNMLRVANPSTSATETILDAMQRIPGVGTFKKSDSFTGNEFASMILSSQYVRPIIGMPVTATPIARVTPMDDWNNMIWCAAGLQIKADSAGRSGVLYASAA